ncbi:MAG TPA: DnaB-like helicase C-terminal domain-containing protein, partial [Pirellulaceae bacterium]|nr:DnaB-like helicase C-terminal domain-containing protein [Pirellulaceae bacterium]
MLGELNTNEQSVLGSIFLSEDALEKAVAALSVDDFTDYRNQIIWRHVLQLHNAGRPANNPELLVTSLRNTIDRAGQSDLDHAGGLVYIGTIIDSVAVAHHVSYLIAEVLKASTVRRLKAVGREITAKAEQHPLNEDTADLVSQCEQLVSDAFDRSAKTGGNHNSLRELLEHALERIDQRRNGICNSGLSTGFTGLDKIMGGLRPGELIVLGARPGCGKSALAMNLAHNMTAHHKRRVMLISLEMSSTEIADRMLGSAAKVNTHRMRNGSLTAGDRESIVAAYGLMSTASLFIDDKPSCTCAQISSQARSIKRRHGLD